MSERTSVLPPRFDALDPAVIEDPYPTYARLRDAGALCRGMPGSWVVTRYAEVAALMRDRRLGSEFPIAYHQMSAGEGPASEFMSSIMLYRDPPAHTRLRRLVGQAFDAQLVRGLERHIGELVDDLLEPLGDGVSFDAIGDLAFPLPVMVVCELMGIPTADHETIRPLALKLGRAFMTMVPSHTREAANAAVLELREYLGALLEERRRSPGEDLLSHMLAAEEGEDRLTHEEIVDNAVFSFFAGFETTTNLIGNGCAALLRHPDQLARLYADLSLLSSAIDEFLRYDAPIQGVARVVGDSIEIAGRRVMPGRVLVLLLGSANRDERAFARPDELDIGRRPNRHLSFGGGIHYCMGATLSRIEARMAFARLLERFASLEPAGEPVRETETCFRAYSSLPIVASLA
ncbi:MAG TPA: cytochrome P450 [Solirubrobacteraceae bacterium]|jgi:cytochrome P450|nr:cytochrome P450 [Solirubrobacteraceae bacterium]